jgi:hypothetical protein
VKKPRQQARVSSTHELEVAHLQVSVCPTPPKPERIYLPFPAATSPLGSPVTCSPISGLDQSSPSPFSTVEVGDFEAEMNFHFERLQEQQKAKRPESLTTAKESNYSSETSSETSSPSLQEIPNASVVSEKCDPEDALLRDLFAVEVGKLMLLCSEMQRYVLCLPATCSFHN